MRSILIDPPVQPYELSVKYSRKNISRKCPKEPARDYPIGKKKKGLDGKMWKVVKLKNNLKKWIRVN